mgnify:CR=1 FL=1
MFGVAYVNILVFVFMVMCLCLCLWLVLSLFYIHHEEIAMKTMSFVLPFEFTDLASIPKPTDDRSVELGFACV